MVPAMPAQYRPEPTGRRADFGFRNVPEDHKVSLVRAVFDSVAPSYDLMNDLMSLGIHRLWKAALIDWLNPRPGMRLLDVGGGTGDIALGFLERGGGRVEVCDISREMVAAGRDRAIDRGLLAGITWMCGDAEALPCADASVDAYATAFCIRNVTRVDAALAEARRRAQAGRGDSCAWNSAASPCRSWIGSTTPIPSAFCRPSARSWPATANPTATWPRASGAFRPRRNSPP